MTGNIFLIGFMGTGKTTVSQELKKRLQMKELDLDQEIERRAGRKISEIFTQQGEDVFRQMETELIAEMAEEDGYVISCGGGAVLRPENVEHMKKHGAVVLLTAEPETVYQRVHRSKHRPLLNENMSVAYIEQLMEQRVEAYQGAADLLVATDARLPIEIAEEIEKKLRSGNFSFAF